VTDIDAGPRRLRVMPAAEQRSLDPYMSQIVTYRKSGLSLNHIVGCPLDCGYCVRHFWGNFDQKTPQLLVPTTDAIDLLVEHPAFRATVTPIQLFNKATDPFLPGVKPHLFQILEALDAKHLDNLVLVITRYRVTADDMARLEQLRHLRVTLLFTYSGITDARVEPIARGQTTIRSIEVACATKDRTKVVLYWRPIVPGWNDQPDTMAHVLEAGRGADAIVFTGYYHKDSNAQFLRGLGVDIPYGHDYQRRKMLPLDLDTRVIDAWRASRTATPLFRKTSCGVTHAHRVADYNGHIGMPELCDICPAEQRHRCESAYRHPTDVDLERLLDELGYDTPFQIDDGHIWTHGLGEQRRYALQHTLGYQIWEADLPHFAHAHGRALHGYQPTETEQTALDMARQRIATDLRSADD
jgi:DNA repair photolyase